MEHYSFDQLPEAVGLIQEKLRKIESLLLLQTEHPQQNAQEELLTVEEAAEFLKLSVPTIYGKVSKREIPANKKDKRLYFFRSELEKWVRAGRKKTIEELQEEADVLISKRVEGLINTKPKSRV